ncbi:MAG: sulfatase-like hydrolase/transferase [Gemmatimonadetes bacterium]|nr:sulfatase-like hydrolase/transferase [Gemmatimonadota bacterium]MBT5056989.1 sulfatase-like hydrolase/transferase [Gemmatimonadota bacterium]MBT5142242.1 sulfatase-like hydrolase/transferase [Gemmatimonadota bacterium]MBT5589173.1 sulfatase-like hydrolase/transferase [Gemmatimonadota bacterium]MBT5963177.1 sulfatase-like hydrolase/transferase [Gemmatimonadota bacterium]
MNSQGVRPNFLWISLEDTSPRFGCYGDTVARTPNIDRLAAGGCIYPNAFSVAGVCAPSRAAIITGMYPTSIGAHHMRTSHVNELTDGMPTPYDCCPPPYVKCFTEYLRSAGYFCTNNAKTDYQFSPPRTAWDELGNQGHWRHRADDQPFFAVFNPTVTHESGMWPEKRQGPLRTDPTHVELPPYLPDTLACREALAQHYDNLETADQRVGEILDQLEEDGLAENTIVFLWSDHGEGLPRGKRWPYDAGIRVPLIVRWPNSLPAGSCDQQLVSLIDLGPTLLSLAGATRPQHLQGQPFLGDDSAPRDHVFASRDRHDEAYDRVRAVRDHRYKLIRHHEPQRPYLPWIPYRNKHPVMQELWRRYAVGSLEGPEELLFQPRPIEELYDTLVDPFEMINLADDAEYGPILTRLRSSLDGWMRDVGDLGEMSEPQMVRRWYPDGTQPLTATPMIALYDASHPGLAAGVPAPALRSPALAQLQCSTEGASIAYTLESGDDCHWSLYTQPIRLPAGRLHLRARAIRLGYQESEQLQERLEVAP